MSNHNPNRVSKGVAEGGQFATGARAESDVSLAPVRTPWRDVTPSQWDDIDTGRSDHLAWHRQVHTSDPFKQRMRLLVGAPDGASVNVIEEEDSTSVAWWDTRESSSSVSVKVGDAEYTYDSLPELLTRLDYADSDRPGPLKQGRRIDTLQIKEQHLSRLGTFHMLTPEGAAATTYGRIANADEYFLLAAVPAHDKTWTQGRGSEHHMGGSDGQERLVRIYASDLLTFEVDEARYWCCDCEQQHDGAAPDPLYCPACAGDHKCTSCGQISYSVFEWNNGMCRSCARASQDTD